MCTYRVEISEQLVISLTVAESTMEDAGEYAVRVYNEYGEVTSTTQVNILFEAPTFTVPPTDQQVRHSAIDVHADYNTTLTKSIGVGWVGCSASSACLFVRSITQQEGWLSPMERASISAISLRHILASLGTPLEQSR